MMYCYVSSGFNLNEHGDQSENYFIAHPEGRVDLEWLTGLSDETCLETIGDRTIAYLTFHSEKEDATLRCSVSSSSDSRLIEISSTPFQMWTSWLHFWRIE
jgi:hypothetical protein